VESQHRTLDRSVALAALRPPNIDPLVILAF
jgi:hypothetical protein